MANPTRILVLGLLSMVCMGCTTKKSLRPSSWLNPFQGPEAADVVVMDVVLLERPIGDRYINEELWTAADEQVIALERKALIEDNGFRIGQVGGIPPAGLQALLTSERSCVNPRRLGLHAEHPAIVKLGPTLPHCDFQIHEDGKLRPVALEQADGALVIVPTLTRDGRTRLRCTPQLQSGEKSLVPVPSADRSGWVLQEQRPTQTFAALNWEVTLAPNEYALVGAHYSRPGTFGHQCFIRKDGPVPVQRLLVIRTGRPDEGVGTETARGPLSGDALFRRAPPLAFQASYTAVRGHAP